MDDGFSATFNIDKLPRHVWESMRLPGADDAHCRIPGFPSIGADPNEPGCLVCVLETDPERLLRCRKEDMPCAGTEIVIRLDPANASGWPTLVSISQTGFGPMLDTMRDVFETHWHQIVADFRLYLERQVIAPGTAWGADLGALSVQTPIGLELTQVTNDAFADRCGMQTGDLLLTLNGIRIHDIAQLWTVLALAEPGTQTHASWVRGDQAIEGTAAL